MTVNRTTLLDLPLPVTGTESGTWGDTTNNGLTQYMDIAIAGMSNLTSANFTTGALTIETTEGNSSATNITATSGQYAGFRVTSLAQNSTITVGNTGTSPARSYRLINADATYTLTFKATGQTGITLQPGQTAVVAFNGTDYVIVGMAGAGTVTDNAVVRFDGTTGKLVQNSVVTIADTTGDVAGVGALTMGGNLTLSGGTANGVLYLNGSKVATSGSALTFDGTTFQYTGAANFATSSGNVGIGTSSPNQKLEVAGTTPSIRLNSGGTPASLYGLEITNGTSVDGYFRSRGPTGETQIGSGRSAGWGGYITFYTDTTEQMRLTSTGLGIGTSSPSVKLHVKSSSIEIAYFESTNASNFAYTFYKSATGNGAYVGINGNGDFIVQTPGSAYSTKLTLDSSGNLGLGVTPSAWASTYRALEGSFGQTWFYSNTVLETGLSSNATKNGANWIYKTTNAAVRYEMGNVGHAWFTAPSGTAGNAITFTQALTLDASGNLLVGHTAVYSPVSNYKSVQINGVTGGIVDMGDGSGVYGRTSADVNGLNLEALGSRYTAFRTNGSERARITSGGNLLVGGTSNTAQSEKLQVTGTIGMTVSTPQINFYGTGSTIEFVNRDSGGAKTFSWYYAASGGGSPATLSTSGVWTNASDARGKENISEIHYGLDTVMALYPRQYDVKSDGSHAIGFVAQEVLPVVPELVHVTRRTENDEFYGLDYGSMTAVLVKAIQEQQEMIDSLKAELALLKKK